MQSAQKDQVKLKESASFLKKRSKKLSFTVGVRAVRDTARRKQKFFCCFFFKKRSAF
jgi:hypothetical protein